MPACTLKSLQRGESDKKKDDKGIPIGSLKLKTNGAVVAGNRINGDKLKSSGARMNSSRGRHKSSSGDRRKTNSARLSGSDRGRSGPNSVVNGSNGGKSRSNAGRSNCNVRMTDSKGDRLKNNGAT